jgi:hypothetical protein
MEMKINLIGMILNNCGRYSFEGALTDEFGNQMSAADSLHHMILEYAKVANGGTSDVVTASREVTPNVKVRGGTLMGESLLNAGLGNEF